MIDDQKVVYEQIVYYAKSCILSNKRGVFLQSGQGEIPLVIRCLISWLIINKAKQ